MDKDRIEYNITRKLSEAGTEHIHYPAICNTLPEGFEQYARTVLNETEENKKMGIRKLREFVRKENLEWADDSHLIMVLRGCKYDIKKSESKLKRFLKSRRGVITELAKLDMETIETLIDGDFFQILPYRDRCGRVILYTLPRLELDKYKCEDVWCFAMAVILYTMSFPMNQVYGVAYLADNTCETISVYYPIMKIFKKIVQYLPDMPCRITRVDLTNEHFMVRWAYTLLRPILPEKITKRVTFHGSNFEELHNYYHADLLPGEVCGNLGLLPKKHYRKDLLQFIEKLREEN